MILPGTTISHYRILDQLGSGGMGVVYRAVDTRLDRTVAIKFLPPHLGANPKARERFIAEAKAASSLDYPTIGTIYEVDETPETGMFIVMAYYAGESLAVRIHRGPLPPAEAVDFAIQVGEGLARAHDRGITHRDVKPGNVMITPGGLVKILDFGLAKVTDISLTDAGLTLGTPAYMSPEQSAGETVDHRSDIWSLGVVLYHMLSGQLPFDGDSTAEVLRAIRHRDPAPIDCSPALHSVLSRALAKPLRDRYASMRFFVADLRAAHQTVTPPPGYEPNVTGRLTGDEPTVSAVLPAAAPPKSAGELRQLTILACCLAEFGALADALGHEQLSLVLTAFHKVCEEAGHHLEGRIASASEGEVVLHFGLPQAHEDDAVRAVTAGLVIAGETGRLQRELADHIRAAASLPLSIRVGVHTGLVVVDDPSPTVSQHVVVGMTGVVAARTRDAAAGGAVVITEDTSRLVTGAFELRQLGPASLQGVSRAVSLFHVEGLAPVGGKWEATQAGLNELVGRDRDLGVLADSWQEVKEGNGQVVLISAEAGVGKSRLVAALKSTLAPERHTRLESRCSPYHRNSPLWPIVDLLARGFSLDRSNPPAERFAKMRGILTPHRLATPENLYLMASLLSLPYPETEPRPAIPPQREKERTLALLMNLLRVMSSEQPVLFVVEDLHWADPTTLELLSLVVDQGPTAPLMTVVTFRPEFSSPWGRRAHLTHLTLSRLSRRDAERLVASMAGVKALPRELVAQIVGNADGVPLFLEELTKTLLQSDALQETSSSFEPRLPSSPLAIPATLKDSLMARLDRLGSAKEVAQMAAVLGRTFHYEWLQAISPLGDHLLRQDLLRLVDAELLFQRGVPPDATYTFKHALIKDAAYQALLTPARQHYHARIAQALAERFKDVAETQPELLAHHYAEAGLVEQAVSHWQKAGQHAARRSGHVEAAVHFGHALELVRTLPGSADHTQQELDLLVAQGSVLMATMGWAAPAVGDVYTQALHLSGEAGASRRLFDVLQGLVSYYLVRSQHRVARDLSERLVAVAAELNDPPLKMEAALRMGISAYVTGSLAEAHLHLGSVSTETAPGEPRPPMLYGQDRGVVAQCHWSWVWWLTGFPDRALAEARGALTVALALNHPFSVAWARLYVAIMHSLRGEAEAAAEQADALAAVCTEQAFSYRLAQAEILRGWSQAALTGDAVPIERIRTGSARIRATGAEAYRPYYAMLYAGACLSVRDWPAGIVAIDDALGLVETTAECFLEAELHRLRGELILASEPSRIDDAVADYQRALEVAAGQGALALELRAAASLLRAVPGGPGNRERLAIALARTTEGLETVEYASYRSLLT